MSITEMVNRYDPNHNLFNSSPSEFVNKKIWPATLLSLRNNVSPSDKQMLNAIRINNSLKLGDYLENTRDSKKVSLKRFDNLLTERNISKLNKISRINNNVRSSKQKIKGIWKQLKGKISTDTVMHGGRDYRAQNKALETDVVQTQSGKKLKWVDDILQPIIQQNLLSTIVEKIDLNNINNVYSGNNAIDRNIHNELKFFYNNVSQHIFNHDSATMFMLEGDKTKLIRHEEVYIKDSDLLKEKIEKILNENKNNDLLKSSVNSADLKKNKYDLLLLYLLADVSGSTEALYQHGQGPTWVKKRRLWFYDGKTKGPIVNIGKILKKLSITMTNKKLKQANEYIKKYLDDYYEHLKVPDSISVNQKWDAKKTDTDYQKFGERWQGLGSTDTSTNTFTPISTDSYDDADKTRTNYYGNYFEELFKGIQPKINKFLTQEEKKVFGDNTVIIDSDKPYFGSTDSTRNDYKTQIGNLSTSWGVYIKSLAYKFYHPIMQYLLFGYSLDAEFNAYINGSGMDLNIIKELRESIVVFNKSNGIYIDNTDHVIKINNDVLSKFKKYNYVHKKFIGALNVNGKYDGYELNTKLIHQNMKNMVNNDVNDLRETMNSFLSAYSKNMTGGSLDGIRTGTSDGVPLPTLLDPLSRELKIEADDITNALNIAVSGSSGVPGESDSEKERRKKREEDERKRREREREKEPSRSRVPLNLFPFRTIMGSRPENKLRQLTDIWRMQKHNFLSTRTLYQTSMPMKLMSLLPQGMHFGGSLLSLDDATKKMLSNMDKWDRGDDMNHIRKLIRTYVDVLKECKNVNIPEDEIKKLLELQESCSGKLKNALENLRTLALTLPNNLTNADKDTLNISGIDDKAYTEKLETYVKELLKIKREHNKYCIDICNMGSNLCDLMKSYEKEIINRGLLDTILDVSLDETQKRQITGEKQTGGNTFTEQIGMILDGGY